MIQIPPDEPESLVRERPDQHLPLNSGMIPMLLFLASLTMLFLALMVGYLFIRVKSEAPGFGQIHLPAALWASTLILLASSVTMHLAVKDVKQERQGRFRKMMLVSVMLSVFFVLIQFPSLIMLLNKHHEMMAEHTRQYYYGLIFFMIVIHAVHVVGGLIPLCVITYKAQHGGYDHESYGPVKYTAAYWHFLDIVWLVMFFTMYFVG